MHLVHRNEISCKHFERLMPYCHAWVHCYCCSHLVRRIILFMNSKLVVCRHNCCRMRSYTFFTRHGTTVSYPWWERERWNECEWEKKREKESGNYSNWNVKYSVICIVYIFLAKLCLKWKHPQLFLWFNLLVCFAVVPFFLLSLNDVLHFCIGCVRSIHMYECMLTLQ